MAIEHDASTGTGEAGVRKVKLDAITKNVILKCPSPVRMHWAPYTALFAEVNGSVKLTMPKFSDEESSLKQNAFQITHRPALSDPIRQGHPVFGKPNNNLHVEAKKDKRQIAIKAGQENIEIKRFQRLGENPAAWQGLPIKVDRTGRTDPRTKAPVYEVNDGHHRLVWQATRGTGILNLDVREKVTKETPDQWSSLVWLVESWGHKGMSLDETIEHLKSKELKSKQTFKKG